MTNTAGGSDLALDNSLMGSDGSRQLKLIRYGAFLNRKTRFRCKVFLGGAKHLWVYSRNQADQAYYEKTFEDIPQGRWTTLEFAFSDLQHPKDATKKVQDGWFMANLYLVARPAEGKARKDVQLLLDDIICYDAPLKHDPFKDPEAPAKALLENPIWTARGPASE